MVQIIDVSRPIFILFRAAQVRSGDRIGMGTTEEINLTTDRLFTVKRST
jgi:hypothetical protein